MRIEVVLLLALASCSVAYAQSSANYDQGAPAEELRGSLPNPSGSSEDAGLRGLDGNRDTIPPFAGLEERSGKKHGSVSVKGGRKDKSAQKSSKHKHDSSSTGGALGVTSNAGKGAAGIGDRAAKSGIGLTDRTAKTGVGLTDRAAKTSVGASGKAVKEVFKVFF